MNKSKKYLKGLYILILTIFIFNCKAQAQLQQISTYSTDIIGTWISNDDELWKVEFNSNGQKKDYYNNEIVETTSYVITNTCNGYTRNNGDFFLKSIGLDNIEVCDLLNNIHTDELGVTTLSITTESGKSMMFTKQ